MDINQAVLAERLQPQAIEAWAATCDGPVGQGGNAYHCPLSNYLKACDPAYTYGVDGKSVMVYIAEKEFLQDPIVHWETTDDVGSIVHAVDSRFGYNEDVPVIAFLEIVRFHLPGGGGE